MRGVALVGAIKSAALVEIVAPGRWWEEAAARVRRRVRLALERRVAPGVQEPSAIATAILIGDRGGLSDDTERRLQAAGTYHVIAISGGNIAILAGVLLGSLALIGVRGRFAAISALTVLAMYVVVAVRRRVGGACGAHGSGLPVGASHRSAHGTGERDRGDGWRPPDSVAVIARGRRLLAHVRRHRGDSGWPVARAIARVVGSCSGSRRARRVMCGRTRPGADWRVRLPACHCGGPPAEFRRATGHDRRPDCRDGGNRLRPGRTRRGREYVWLAHGRRCDGAHSHRLLARLRALVDVARAVAIDGGPRPCTTRRWPWRCGRVTTREVLLGFRERSVDAIAVAGESRAARQPVRRFSGLDRRGAVYMGAKRARHGPHPDDVRRGAGRRDARHVSERASPRHRHRRRRRRASTSAIASSARLCARAARHASTTSRSRTAIPIISAAPRRWFATSRRTRSGGASRSRITRRRPRCATRQTASALRGEPSSAAIGSTSAAWNCAFTIPRRRTGSVAG